MAYNREAQARYAKKCVFINIKMFPTDSDILDYLAEHKAEEPTATRFKRLIRAEMRAKGLPVREVGKTEDADEE